MPSIVAKEEATRRQEKLAQLLGSGVPKTEALAAAGYGCTEETNSALRSQGLQTALKLGRQAELHHTLAGKALKAIGELIEGESTPAATRFAASKWVLEQTGHGGGADDAKDKPLAEMTTAELEAFLARAQKIVDGGGPAPVISVIEP